MLNQAVGQNRPHAARGWRAPDPSGSRRSPEHTAEAGSNYTGREAAASTASGHRFQEAGRKTATEIAGFEPRSARSAAASRHRCPYCFSSPPLTAALPPQRPDPAESPALSSIKLHLVSNPPCFRRPGCIYLSRRFCILFLCGKEY